MVDQVDTIHKQLIDNLILPNVSSIQNTNSILFIEVDRSNIVEWNKVICWIRSNDQWGYDEAIPIGDWSLIDAIRCCRLLLIDPISQTMPLRIER